MAQKRALVAAVLIACNASAFYTQDVEDMRTIDVDYEPFEGSRENQDEYLRSKNIEPRHAPPKHDHHQPPATKPETIRELSDTLDQPSQAELDATEPPGGWQGASGTRYSADRPTSTIEQRETAKRAEAEEVLNRSASEPKPAKKKKGIVSFEALKSWGKLKDDLRALTGTDAIYYSALKAKGYDHANEIATEKDAASIFGVLGVERNRLKNEKDLLDTLTHASEVISVRELTDILGVHGCEIMADVLKMEGDPLAALLAEVKARVDERKGV